MSLLKPMLILSLFLFSTSLYAASTSVNTTEFKLKPVPELQDPVSDRFPGDAAEHKAVYMFNKSDAGYQHGILNSMQAMIKNMVAMSTLPLLQSVLAYMCLQKTTT
jgi:hypothetical protein